MKIVVYYSSIDGGHARRTFRYLAPARAWAQSWVGRYPELGIGYAVSGDGIGKIECEGCKLRDLFPEPAIELTAAINDDPPT